MSSEIEKYEEEKERKERIEHRDVLLALGAVLTTKEGIQIFEYLFKHLEVATLPDQGADGKLLFEHLGFLRAGNSVYQLVCEADSEKAAHILAKIERKRYEDLYEQHRIANGLKRNEREDE